MKNNRLSFLLSINYIYIYIYIYIYKTGIVNCISTSVLKDKTGMVDLQ